MSEDILIAGLLGFFALLGVAALAFFTFYRPTTTASTQVVNMERDEHGRLIGVVYS